MLHHMAEGDPDSCVETCCWFLSKQAKDDKFLSTVMFSDKANYCVKDEVQSVPKRCIHIKIIVNVVFH